MDFFNQLDYMMLLKSFIVGGLICIVGQILIDKTKLTPARILVIFVTTGAILGGLGVYQYLIDFAGCGATVPLTGFGNSLAKGAIEGAREKRIYRSVYWWNIYDCRRYCCCSIFWIHRSNYFKT